MRKVLSGSVSRLFVFILIAALALGSCALADGPLINKKKGNQRSEATAEPAVTQTPAPTPDPQSPLLPDPGYYIRALAVLTDEDLEYDGMNYRVYTYSYTEDINAFVGNLGGYSWSLSPKDFEWTSLGSFTSKVSAKITTYRYAISQGDATAYAEISSAALNPNRTLVLYVPENMRFEPDTELQPTRSPYSFYNTVPPYWDDMEVPVGDPSSSTTCVACYGSGRCSLCGGTGSSRNPYTGTSSDCSCGNGVCSICDGTGVW